MPRAIIGYYRKPISPRRNMQIPFFSFFFCFRFTRSRNALCISPVPYRGQRYRFDGIYLHRIPWKDTYTCTRNVPSLSITRWCYESTYRVCAELIDLIIPSNRSERNWHGTRGIFHEMEPLQRGTDFRRIFAKYLFVY